MVLGHGRLFHATHVTKHEERARRWWLCFLEAAMSQRRMTLASIDTNKAPPTTGFSKTSRGMPPPVSGGRPRPSLAMRRSSVAMFGGDVRPRMSLMPGQRRSVGVGRMSLAPGTLPPVPALKDSRLRIKNARATMESNLLLFLETTGFTMPGWNSRLVHEPTQSAFSAMFRHIYRECIDPGYQLGADGRKFEEEVMLLTKEIRYPFVDDLTKTKLTAAGSQQNWPACLALLDWMVRLGSAVGPSHSGPLERDDDNELHALFFPYLWKCYERFWDNQDTYPEEMEVLAQSFASKNAALAETVEALASAKQELDAELSSLTDNPSPLQREEHENHILQGDLAKFVKYHNEVLLPKLEKSRRTIQRLDTALEEHAAELKEKQAERERRQALVDTQDVSPEEFERMMSEREWLARQLEELALQNREAVEQCWKVELALTRQQAEVEKRLKTFQVCARRVRLLPLSLPNGVELTELELVPANPTTMLAPGVSMQAVRAKVDSLRAAESEAYRRLSHERLALQESYDELLEGIEGLRRNTHSLETRLETLREQIDEVGRVTTQEDDESSAEYIRQEGIVSSIDHASTMALQQAEARWKALQLQYVPFAHPDCRKASLPRLQSGQPCMMKCATPSTRYWT